jgi:hypothetical protein
MNTLIDIQPTRIIQRDDATIFYYGVEPANIGTLPGNSTFGVAYSPTEHWGWEYVCYQVFASGNGVFISERRTLKEDEVAYLRTLIAAFKGDSDES